MAGDLRSRWVCTLTDHLKFHFKLKPFYRVKKSVGKGFGIQGKVNPLKSCSILSSVSWAVVFSCVLSGGHLSLEHESDAILTACCPPEAQRWNSLWSPGIKVGHTFSSWNNSFLRTLITKLISYYLKLKFFQHLSPHQCSLDALRGGTRGWRTAS